MKQTTVKGVDIDYKRINNDTNGNPRYVVHFLDLGVKLHDYGKIKGLRMYRGKDFGGGYVFQSYNVEESLSHMMDIVEDFYN